MEKLDKVLFTIKESIYYFDDVTKEHSKRMMILSRDMVNVLRLSDAEREVLEIACAIHDIGKRYIPLSILNKKEKLTDEEWERIKTHPLRGWELLNRYPLLTDVANGVLYHHEKWDGSGYPTGKKKEDIPIISRVISVIDAFDAMTNIRPYNTVMNPMEALNELDRHAGTQFDPDVCHAFVNMYKDKYLYN